MTQHFGEAHDREIFRARQRFAARGAHVRSGHAEEAELRARLAQRFHQRRAEQVRNIKNAYRVLYRSDLKLDDAVQRLEALAATQPELRMFVDFIGKATRSLVR